MDELTLTVLFLVGLINLIIIIVFFVMAARLRKILNILKIWSESHLKIHGYERKIVCENCNKEIVISPFRDGIVICPECKKNTRTDR